MEITLTEKDYHIPFSRLVELDISNPDRSKPVLVKIKNPPRFENEILTAKTKGGKTIVAIHKRIGGKMLYPTTVSLKAYQIKDDPIPKPVPEEKANPNPPPIPKQEKKSILKTVLSGKIKPVDWKTKAIEEADQRKERLTKIRQEVNHASALKPYGLDGKKILTGDDCDYSRGMGLIEILRRVEEKHNEESGLTSSNQKKVLCEFYDVVSFSGIGVVIGLYIALGTKTRGKGSLDYLAHWYKTELSKAYSPTSIGEIKKKGKQLVEGFKPKKLKKSPNPGLSIKQAEKIIGELFTDEFTGKPLRVSDLQCEIYQPIFFDDEQTRVYTNESTPTAKIVDVAVNTGLDPLYFQSKKVEIGIPLGPSRRSFDLPLAQHNKNITLVSVGSELTYQESEENMEGVNPAQLAFLNKRKTYRLDYLDTHKYMEDHASSVNYLRIEAGHMIGVMANSISMKDLEDCRKSADRSKWCSNGKKTAIDWS